MAKIEIEKKFLFTKEQKVNFTKDAEVKGRKTFTDTYFDNANSDLAKRNFWLRNRAGKFELKVLSERFSDKMDIYTEISYEEEIKKALGFYDSESLARILVKENFTPFCVCKTTRETYLKDGLTLDLDLAEFPQTPGFTFSLGEIEILVDNESEIENAKERILKFIQENGIVETKTEGKIYEFMKVNNPALYALFVESRNKLKLKSLSRNLN